MPKLIITLECEHCGISFERTLYPSQARTPQRFCSPSCRNKARSLKLIPCPICEKPFKPRKAEGGIRFKFCSQECAWTSQLGNPKISRKIIHDTIKGCYASEGAKSLSDRLGISVSAIRDIAYRHGITLDSTKYKELVHGAAQAYMIANNPMHNETSKRKGIETSKKSPKHKEHFRKFLEGHQKLRKDKPSKPELKTCAILDSLNINYEHQFLVGNKFVVDFRIGSLIIQVDGEYWHGHPRFMPLTERQIAQQKRDKSHDAYCRACGYTVVRIWERDINEMAIRRVLHQNAPTLGPSASSKKHWQ